MLPSSRLRRSVRLAGVRLSAVTLASAALLLLLVAFSAFLLSAVGGLRETGTYASTRRNVAGTGDIFIFDTAAAWRSLRVPKCDIEDSTSEAMLIKGLAARRYSHYSSHHSLDQHASAWYLGQALRSSPHVTHDLEAAASVFVDLTCYFNMYWWSRYLPPEERAMLAPDPWVVFLQVMQNIPEVVPVDKAVIFLPVPWNAGCDTVPWLASAVTVAVESLASCAPPERTIIAPYNSNLDAPRAVNFANRATLLTYIGGAAAEDARSAGEQLRYHVAKQLQGQAGVFVQVACLGCAGAMDHKEVVRQYQSSVFCLVPPGDTPSSRRATEVIVHGCLPVFLGSPFNNQPLSSVVDFSEFSLVVRVSDISDWVRTPDHTWQVQHWVPDSTPTHLIRALDELVPTIRSVPSARVRRMQEALERARSAFLYKTVLDPEDPSAVDLILQRVRAVR
ncbi:putative arabinosyltransferase ARAD1 [Micractinium conductrix]|uniref:Arabinosyltransferase ARAD1 n=1 Tax=Micractinium conductrix TaxID=554055 RepID=A0A2P6V8W0_9CHLO|nr:putative arabinosyltransferase ARAD1 [Micractinium conductrix]|eukprot:PSC70522.1 putative arabinosyltransferase ARAD1 [Micractinium conductrix]